MNITKKKNKIATGHPRKQQLSLFWANSTKKSFRFYHLNVVPQPGNTKVFKSMHYTVY